MHTQTTHRPDRQAGGQAGSYAIRQATQQAGKKDCKQAGLYIRPALEASYNENESQIKDFKI